uniref:Uncharacterized protein n=1 Tax=Castor canadensis TaxID=51338 RepID=A0A8C0WLY7_CASCN
MDTPVIYADLNLSRTSRLENSSRSFPPQDICQGPSCHQLALKLGCAVILLLVLSVIGLSVSVVVLIQKSSIEKCIVDIQENRTETTERSPLVECPPDWHSLHNKCLGVFHSTSKSWNDSRSDCSEKESSLLLIQDQEELIKNYWYS